MPSRGGTYRLQIFTIGFTRTSAESFFRRLTHPGVTKVVDVRLSNESQLAGLAKRNDLKYFLDVICGIAYEHRTELTPTPELIDGLKKRRGPWSVFEDGFNRLMAERGIEEAVSPEDLDRACLLCSEDTADHCHRRLIVEYLGDRWGAFEVCHL